MENEKVDVEKKRKKRKGKSGRIVIVLIVVLAALLGGFFLYKKKTSSQKSQGDQSVSTATVKRTDISSELTASSSLSPKDTYEVTALVEGDHRRSPLDCPPGGGRRMRHYAQPIRIGSF